MKTMGRFQLLVDKAEQALTKSGLREAEVELHATKNQKAYYRRQFNEYRSFNRGMFALGKMSEESFIHAMELEYVVEKAIDMLEIEVV